MNKRQFGSVMLFYCSVNPSSARTHALAHAHTQVREGKMRTPGGLLISQVIETISLQRACDPEHL